MTHVGVAFDMIGSGIAGLVYYVTGRVNEIRAARERRRLELIERWYVADQQGVEWYDEFRPTPEDVRGLRDRWDWRDRGATPEEHACGTF